MPPHYRADDILLLGRESAGVPDAVAADADLRVRIPMRAGLRSLNVALAATPDPGRSAAPDRRLCRTH